MPRSHRTANFVTLTCPECGIRFPCLECRARDTRTRKARQFCGRQCYWAHGTTPLVDRFWQNVVKSDSCWLWIGTVAKSGYGIISVRQGEGRRPRPKSVHRVSWELHNGSIPEEIMVCHKCDVRNCVRPDHLFLGTGQDNMDDMAQKGRSAFGVKNVNAKLTDDLVREIRARYTPGTRGLITQMAKEYGVDFAAMASVVKRKTWKHVE